MSGDVSGAQLEVRRGEQGGGGLPYPFLKIEKTAGLSLMCRR